MIRLQLDVDRLSFDVELQSNHPSPKQNAWTRSTKRFDRTCAESAKGEITRRLQRRTGSRAIRLDWQFSPTAATAAGVRHHVYQATAVLHIPVTRLRKKRQSDNFYRGASVHIAILLHYFCLSVRLSHCEIVPKWNAQIVKKYFSPSGRASFLILPHHYQWRSILTGGPWTNYIKGPIPHF